MRDRRRRLLLFPVLLAAWPVLFLYAENVEQVRRLEALTALAGVAGVALVVVVVATVLLRDPRRGALLAAVVVLAVLLEGHAAELLDNPSWLAPVWIAVALALAVIVIRLRRYLTEYTRIAAGVSVTVLVIAAIPVLQAGDAAAAPGDRNGQPAPPDAVSRADVPGWAGAGTPRDVYYLVFDRYGSESALRERFGWDNSAFVNALTERGFDVVDDARANHLRTAQSLASSLNMHYLTYLEDRYGADTGNQLPVFDLLADHALGRILRGHGYEHVHIGAWWDPTEHNDLADLNLGYERRSDFIETLWDTTLFAELDAPQAPLSGEQRRRSAYDGTLEQLAALRSAAARPGPTFTFAHILLPHQPFVFDAEGQYQSLEDDAERGHDIGYVEQLQYTNDQILAFVDELLAAPAGEQPIIVLQADEGSHPLRFLADEAGFDWTRASDAELREKMAILTALYLPEVPGAEPPPDVPADLTPVNIWRIVLNTYFGADLPLLPQRSFVFTDEAHVYDFTDVTDRL